MPSYILAIDQGTTSTRSILFRPELSGRCRRAAGIPAAFPVLGLGRARARGPVAHNRRHDQGGARQGSRRAIATSPPSASPTSARRRSSGTARPARPSTKPSSGRTAAPPIICAALKQAGHEAAVHRARPGLLLDPYFSGTKIAWLIDNVDGRTAESGSGRACLRHRRQLPASGGSPAARVHATDATNASRTLAVRHPSRPMGRRPADGSCACRNRDAARGAATASARFGTTEPALFGAAHPDHGHRRRPAGGDGRPGLLRAGHDEIDLWHGLLRAAQYRAGAVSPRSNRLLTTIAYQLDGERTYALEGAIFIAGAAVQWLRDGLKVIDTAKRDAARWHKPPIPSSRSISSRPLSALARPIGSRSARRALRTDPRHRARGTGASRARGGVLPDARSPRGHARRLGRRRRARYCGSMAAWSPRTGPCSALPTSSTRRSTGRRSSKRRQWAPPISRASPRGYVRSQTNSRKAGSSRSASRRGCRLGSGSGNMTAGKKRCASS